MLGERLKLERERLGFTQPAFAELAGAKKRTLIDWEKAVSSPTAVQLAAFAAAGADVLYILTGKSSSAHLLSSEEQTMLEYFRAAQPMARRAAMGALLGAAQGSVSGMNMSNLGDGNVQIQGNSGGNRVHIQKSK